MKPILPRPLPNGDLVIAELPAGTKVVQFGEKMIAVHPDHQPLIINADGTTETLKPEQGDDDA